MYALMTWRVVEAGGLPGDSSVLRLTHWLLPSSYRRDMTRVGNLAALSVVLSMLVAVVVLIARAGARRGALVVILAVGVSLVVKQITKDHVPRPMINGFRFAGDQFPSGHATATMALALAVVVQLWNHPRRDWIVPPAVAYVVVVGFARIFTEIHYTSDVLAGWVLAVTVVAALTSVAGVPARPD